MKLSQKLKKLFPLLLIGGAILIILGWGDNWGMSEAAVTILLVVLSLLFGTIALWTYANRNADGSEWWQDDNASGWRGY